MASERIKGICACSKDANTWVEQDRTRIPIDQCTLYIYECQHCPHKDGYVDLTFNGCKIKYNVNPYYVDGWIKARDIAKGVNESPPTPTTDFGPGEYA